jgi:hypothetical protein
MPIWLTAEKEELQALVEEQKAQIEGLKCPAGDVSGADAQIDHKKIS